MTLKNIILEMVLMTNSILEGGNVEVGGKASVNKVSADKIPVDKLNIEQWEDLKNEIINTLYSFNNLYKQEFGEYLWPKLKSLIQSGKIFSGSAQHFFTKSLKDFQKIKDRVGDIDLLYPKEQKNDLGYFLNNYKGTKFGKLVYIGHGGKSPTQYNTIFRTASFPKIVSNIQIDFVPVEWEDNSPSKFATFAHASPWNDLQKNIKGVFVKYLFRCLASKDTLKNAKVLTKNGKVSNADEYDKIAMYGFSVDNGLRKKYDLVDKRGNKEYYKPIPTSLSNYISDLDDIFKFLFGKNGSANELKKMESFLGMLEIIDKYYSKEDIQKVFDRFIDLMWGEKAQKIENDDNLDFDVKKSAYDAFVNKFKYLEMTDDKFNKVIHKYYRSSPHE